MLSTLEADRAHLATLTAQILDLEETPSALRLEQMQQSRLDSYKYPFLTLPTEIIIEIFIRVPPPYPETTWLAGPLSPTPLTQICREWRQIALSLPSLWRAINLTDNGTPVEQRARICNLWLKRSRSCPLAIEFDAIRDRIHGLSPTKAMALIASNLVRLEHLKLLVLLDDFSIIEGSSMPLLHHLDLELASSSGVFKHVSFGELPLLRSAVLGRTASLRARLPWAQLTSLAVSRVFLYEFAPILSQTSTLMHCELLLWCSGHDNVITLPCLESLVLTCSDYEGCTSRPETLKSFITPALHNLRFSERFLGPDPLPSLTDFMAKSGAKLQEICITGRRLVPKNSYREALQSIPRLSFSQREADHRILSSRVELEIESDSDTD
ncbi:hypothetical protein C8R45DRAFT_1219885 [Mycena sanguinolenta]|nr:hypothetical protein C8R45DRAFT_1219885 [Mycena sanguinolenta]